jgi:hypothetical protein
LHSENEASSISDENGELILEEDFETTHVEQQHVVEECGLFQEQH